MISFKDVSIKKKLIITHAFIAFVVLVLGSAAFVSYHMKVSRSNLVSNWSSTAQIIGTNCISPLLFLDRRAAGDILAALQHEAYIVNAGIYDANGQLFAAYSKAGSEGHVFPSAAQDTPQYSDQYLNMFVPIEKDRSTLDLIFFVEDTGIGIPKDQIDRIFDVFEQQEGQRVNRYGGTGLGLAITRRLVEMMDGEIVVTSEVGAGSIFCVTLKGVSVASVSDLEAEEAPVIDPNAVRFDCATILIADDIEVNRNLVKGFLEPYDFTLQEAENGAEVIRVAEEHSPDLVLMDMQMPVMDGYDEAVARMKADGCMRSIPVVALTASAMKQSAEEIQGLCDGYLRKPVSKAALVAELARFLGHSIEAGQAEDFDLSMPTSGFETMDTDHVAGLPELTRILEGEKGTWEDLCRTRIINQIEAFANRMQKLGESYGFPPLIRWGRELEILAQKLEPDDMLKTLEQLPETIEQIQPFLQV